MAKEVVLFSLENDKMIQCKDGKRWLSCSKCLFKNIDCEEVGAMLDKEGIGNCNDGGYYGAEDE